MAVALLEPTHEDESVLGAMRTGLLSFAQHFGSSYLTLNAAEAGATVVEIEQISKVVDHLQTLAARAAEDHKLAEVDADKSFKTTAEYLRAKLGVSRSEANRRLRLGHDVLPALPGPGAVVEAPLASLAGATSAGEISSRAATVIRDAVHRVSTVATVGQLDAMEEHLTRQAIESDEDVLRVLARRWESVIDQGGQEPTEKTLRARQGVFLKGRRHGLHFIEIGATDEQFEHLVTVMNTATNPRTGSTASDARPTDTDRPDGRRHSIDAKTAGAEGNSGAVGGSGGSGAESGSGDEGGSGAEANSDAEDSPSARGNSDAEGGSGFGGDGGPEGASALDRPTRAQELLDGLVSACRIALSGDGLPATGGHRPQVMVTINLRDLLSDLGHDGHSVFAQQISARSIRKLACDADILPLVLGGRGQILDIGRAQRLFPPHMRRALVARDKGCAFPDCTMPATWCEAHHIVPWAAGGTTNVRDGVLLCSRHHHVMHEGNWSIESVHGIPWFKPPKFVDPGQTLRRNRFWQVEDAVHGELKRAGISTTPP